MKILYFTFSALIVLSSCTSDKEEEVKHQTEQEAITETISLPHDIELINGEKWKVDEGMMIIVQQIANEVQSFQGNTIEEYQTYSKTLSNLIDELTSNCTMKGQAHDELHKWLVPFIDLSKDLKKSTDIAELTKIDGELKSEIVVFGDYFE